MPEQLFVPRERPVPVECRVHERRACDVASKCQPASAFANKEASWAAAIRDISIGGVRLVLRRRFEPGTALGVEMPAGRDGDAYTVFAKVVWTKPLDRGFWALGCKFLSELSEDEVRRLVPESEKENLADATRTTENTPNTVLAHADPFLHDVRFRLTARQGAARQYLIRRLKVPQNWPFEPGKIVVLRSVADDGSPCVLRGKVIGCRREGQGWVLECVPAK